MRDWRADENGAWAMVNSTRRVDYWVDFNDTGAVECFRPGPEWWVQITNRGTTEEAKRFAQSHIRGSDMKRYTECPACGQAVKAEGEEIIENVVIQYKTECPCGLFSDLFDAGVRHERIGAVVFFTSWQDETPRKWENKDAVIEEAKRATTYTERPQFDLGLGQFLAPAADWFEENDFPLNVAGLRERMEKNDNFAPPEGT